MKFDKPLPPRKLADVLPDYESSEAMWARIPRSPWGEAILSDVFIESFEKLLLEGNTRANCLKVLGILPKTLSGWLTTGAADVEAEKNTLHARLCWAIWRGEGEQERRLSRSATAAALNPVTEGALALKMLERRNPESWALAIPERDDISATKKLDRTQMREEALKVLKSATEVADKK